MNDKRKVFVLLKNKIVSIDSILPFAIELNHQCGRRFEFIIWDDKTYYSIVNNNLVILDMIKSVGGIIKCTTKNDNHILNKLKKLFVMFDVIIQYWINGASILHFGGLDVKPLLFFSYFFNKKDLILCESMSTGRRTSDMNNLPRNYIGIYQHRSNTSDFIKYKPLNDPQLRSGILLAFDSQWNWFKHPSSTNVKKIIFSEGKQSVLYRNYIKENMINYLVADDMPKINNNRSVVLILGHFGEGWATHILSKMIFDLLFLLVKMKIDVIIKPHVFTNLDRLNVIIDLVHERESFIHITKLHPQVLMNISRAALFVNTSSVRCEYIDSKFPVIQYTDGHDDLILKDSCSEYICEDIKSLEMCIEKIIESETINTAKSRYKKYNASSLTNTVLCKTQ